MNRSLIVSALTAAAALLVQPARASDLIHQDLDVDVTGDDVHIVIDARVDFSGELPIYALIAPVTEVTVNGEPATVREEEGEYAGLAQWIVPPDGVRGEADVHLVIAGQPLRQSRVTPGADASAYSDDEVFFVPGEPGAQAWLMSLEGFDPFTATVNLRARDQRLTSHGTSTTVEPLGDGTTRTRYTVATVGDLVPIYARNVDAIDDHNLKVGVIGDATDVAARLAATGARVMPIYEDLYGPLPLDEIRVLPVSGRFAFGALGVLGNVFIGDFIARPDFDYLVEQGIAHELAHAWWGGIASAEDPAEGGFLQEAFAEYSAWRALGDDDDDVRTAGVRMNAVWYLTQIDDVGDVPVVGAGNDEAYVLVTYHKGSGVLRALEAKVGSDGFTAALRALAARGPGGLAVDALADDVATATGVDISADVAQWLLRPGHPTLSISRDGADLVVDRGDFAVDVPVRVTHDDGSVHEFVVGADEDRLAVEDAVLVEVDPRWTLVRTVAPAVHGDVSCDGRIDAVDLMEVALRSGTQAPDTRRVDASFDPLYDLDDDGDVDGDDVAAVLE